MNKKTNVPNPVLPEPCEVIRVSHKLSDLTGLGLEYFVENGVVKAKFFNGMMMEPLPDGNSEITKPGA